MTTTPTRPSASRKHTRSTEANRASGLDEGIRITIEGVVYEVRSGDLTARDARELRRQVGMTFPTLLESLGADPDIDLIAALVWLSRRINGEQVAYDDIADEMGYDVFDTLTLGDTAAEEVDPSDPEG